MTRKVAALLRNDMVGKIPHAPSAVRNDKGGRSFEMTNYIVEMKNK